MWRRAYESAAVKGHVYADTVQAFRAWQAAGQRISIYSSGSVEAQKLLFGHSEAGDLLPFIEAHFDTAVGPKSESASYTKIAAALGAASPADITFCTDMPGGV
jgi:enolase-phosphatase E1